MRQCWARFNADLANDLGNLVSRTTTMMLRYSGGMVPEPHRADSDDLDAHLEQQLQTTIDGVRRKFESFHIAAALQDTWDLIRTVNQYLVKREPWALAKRPDARPQLERTLYQAGDALRVTAALIDPVMPQAAERIRGMLGITQESWSGLRPGTLPTGTSLGQTRPLFPRIEKTVEELREMTSEDQNASPDQPPPDGHSPVDEKPIVGGDPVPAEDPKISIDDFMKVELRVAKVLAAEAVPKSKKLLKVTVDAGTEQRTIVAGIAGAYQPEQLVGRTVVIVANLRPAKLMGVESQGMVLAAGPEGHPPMLIACDGTVPPGTRVR